jgi:methionyl-tRNA formyltransferase
MDYGLIVGIAGLFIAILGLIVAVIEYRKRHRAEHIFKTFMVSYPGAVAKIEESCHMANTNVRDAVNLLHLFSEGEPKQNLTKFLNQATQDSMAAKRMCMNLFDMLLANQSAQFKSRDIVYVQKDKLQLCIEEARNNPKKVLDAWTFKLFKLTVSVTRKEK